MKNWWRQYQRQIYLFLILLISYGYFFPRWASWSQNSRLDLVMAIVDQGTLRIDQYYQNTGDFAEINGHYYSDKAPGVAFLGVPVYAVYKTIATLQPVQTIMERLSHSSAFEATLKEEGTGLLVDKIYYAMALYFVTFFIISVPSALLGVLLYNTMAKLGISERNRFWVTLAFGLATPAFAFSGMLFSHQLVAFLLFAAFYLLFQRQPDINRKDFRWNFKANFRLFLVGFLLSWSIISEYPTAMIAAGIGLYALWLYRSFRVVLWGFLGALIPIGMLVAYDLAIFGSVLPVGYAYSVNYQGLHDQGLISLTYPHFSALWGITFGSFRGLFFLSPVLLLAIGGIVIWWLKKIYRAEWLLVVWTVISFLLFNGSSGMWQGGFSVGPRYVIPMLPFLALGLGLAWEKLTAFRTGKVLCAVLTFWSLAAVWLETISGQSFPDWTPNPLFNYSLPKFAAGDIARNLGMVVKLHGVMSLVPLILILIIIGWLYLKSSRNPSLPGLEEK